MDKSRWLQHRLLRLVLLVRLGLLLLPLRQLVVNCVLLQVLLVLLLLLIDRIVRPSLHELRPLRLLLLLVLLVLLPLLVWARLKLIRLLRLAIGKLLLLCEKSILIYVLAAVYFRLLHLLVRRLLLCNFYFVFVRFNIFFNVKVTRSGKAARKREKIKNNSCN